MRCCRHRHRLHLWMGGGVKKVEAVDVEVGTEVVEVVHRMNCHFAFARSSCTGLSSSTPWTIYAVSIATYPSRGTQQLHIPPIGLLELPLHRLIQCMDLITDGL